MVGITALTIRRLRGILLRTARNGSAPSNCRKCPLYR
jgi:hypothetical protein